MLSVCEKHLRPFATEGSIGERKPIGLLADPQVHCGVS